MNLIIAKSLTKVYTLGEIKVKALNNINFEIKPASFVSFVGPSGSGKTTLLNLIRCLDKPTSGKLEVAGTDIARLSRHEAASF